MRDPSSAGSSIKEQDEERIPLSGQQPTAGPVVEALHQASNWTAWQAPVAALRVDSYLRQSSNYRRFSRHGKAYLGAPSIATTTSTVNSSLIEVLANRASRRDFKSAGIPLQSAGRLLHTATSRCRRFTLETGDEVYHGSYPSAGGLYPVNIYCVVRGDCSRTNDYSVWYYDNIACRMFLVRNDISQDELTRALGFARQLPNFGAAVILTGTFARSTSKYGNRGYRFALLEAGHIAQNILLAAEADGLGAYCYGGYTDDCTSLLLSLDNVEEFPLHCIMAGYLSQDRNNQPDDEATSL